MPLSASEFLIPGFGGDPSQGLSNLSNRLWMRNMQSQRLALAQEQKREQAGNFLREYLDNKHYLTGTQYDPVISAQLQRTMSRGAQLAQQGADIPTILNELGPDVAQLSDYSTKAQVINKQADDMIAKMKENGYKGYDYARLKDEALRSAFHEIDPKTGQDTGLKDPGKIDASTNYLMQVLQEHPERVTNAGDFDTFAKESPMQKTLSDIKQYTATGGMSENRVHLIGQNWLVPEKDTRGVTTGLVPKYETAVDNGQPILHEFTDAKGKATSAPVRLLDEGVFDDLMSQKPGAADYIKGLVKQHLDEYKTAKGDEITMGDPRAKLVARALAYDELNRRKSATIENAGIIGKPSAAEVSLHLYGGDEERAYNRRMGRLKADEDSGVNPHEKAENPVETTSEIFNNNPNYLTGQIEHIQVNKQPRNVIDVTNTYQGGTFHFGHGNQDTYTKIYYDPKNRTLITSDGLHTEEHKEGELSDYFKQIAGANKLNAFSIDRMLRKGGYDSKTAKYKTPGDLGDLTQSVQEEGGKQQKQQAINSLVNSGNGDQLVGLSTPNGQITEAGKQGYFSSGKYYIKVKDANGQPHTKVFNKKEELNDYLSGAAPTAPAQAPKSSVDTSALYDKYVKPNGR